MHLWILPRLRHYATAHSNGGYQMEQRPYALNENKVA